MPIEDPPHQAETTIDDVLQDLLATMSAELNGVNTNGDLVESLANSYAALKPLA